IHASAASNDQSPDSGELGGCEGGGALPVCFWSASLRSPCCWSGGFFSWLLPCSCCLRSLLPPLFCECWSCGRPPPLSPGCLPCPLPLSPSCLPWLLPFSPDGCPWEFGLPPWLPELLLLSPLCCPALLLLSPPCWLPWLFPCLPWPPPCWLPWLFCWLPE